MVQESSSRSLLIGFKRAIPVTLVAFGLLVAEALRMQTPFPPYVDDAFIYLRFARNIGSGLGAVWNPGGFPVEGYTSSVYELLLAGAYKIGIVDVRIGAWIGLVSSLVALGLTWRLASLVNPAHDWDNLFAIVLLGASPSFVFWTTSGLETPLYTALLVWSVFLFLTCRRDRVRAWGVGALFGLTALTRPEAAPLFAVTVLFELLYRLVQRERPIDGWLVGVAACFVVLYVPAWAWRWHYFGFPFPNTYYAKTGGGMVQVVGGVRYLLSCLYDTFGGSAIFLIFLVAIARGRRQSSYDVWYLGCLAGASWVLVAADGGDHFGEARFLAPTLPCVYVLAGMGLSRLLESELVARQARLGFRVLVLVVVLAHWANQRPYEEITDGWRKWRTGTAAAIPQAGVAAADSVPWDLGFILMGRALSRLAPPGQSIAVVPVGAIGYYSQMIVVDMVGIVDPVIAHQPFDPRYSATWRPGHDKGDGAYILSRQPDYIQLTDGLTTEPHPEPGEFAMQYKSIVELWHSPEFHSIYQFHPLKVEGGWFYNLYRRAREPVGRQ